MVSEELKKKKDEEASQIWVGIRPSAKLCKTCYNAYKDTKYTVGAEKANCKVYEPPYDKPSGVLWGDDNCEFYLELKNENSSG